VKYVDEYRDPRAARAWIERIRARASRPWRVMEVCGGQTHTLIRYGIDQVLSEAVELIHGPGCPVCVTPLEKIDRAIAIAERPGTILATFGDMVRVPGTRGDLIAAKARGADVRIVYSPMDALRLASENPDRAVVFFAVGFETTAPANAMAVWTAQRTGVGNFHALVSHVRVPPAVRAIMSDADTRVQGFIAPGHVCAVMGTRQYEELALEYGVPFVVAGFEPIDLLQGLARLVDMLEAGEVGADNQYGRTVRPDGNPAARRIVDEVLEVCDMTWRGVGPIPASGMRLTERYAAHDAERRFGVDGIHAVEDPACIAGEVLRGRRKPFECPAFGNRCTPESPLGAPMVSNEGACAAYWTFRRFEREARDAV